MIAARPAEERLMEKVVWNGDEDECWEWQGALINTGYGVMTVERKTVLVHRLAYEIFVGPIPDGEGYHGTCILHRCDNPRCVNPGHLFLGTQADNLADMDSKGRRCNGPLRGSANPNAILDEEKVAEIRRRFAGRRGEQLALGREFGVSKHTINKIVRNRNWKSSRG